MGMICAAGSVILIPYILLSGSWEYFLGSLVVCVAVMGGLVCWRLPRIGLKKSWVLLWFSLLAIAISLQLTVVFRLQDYL